MISLSLIILDIFLQFSGYVIHVIHLYYFSSAIPYVIGPLLLIFVVAKVHNRPLKKVWLHFVAFGFYQLYLIFFYLQPRSFKAFSYLNIYHPEYLALTPEEFDALGMNLIEPATSDGLVVSVDPIGINAYSQELIMLHLAIYLIACFFIIISAFKERQVAIFSTGNHVLGWTRNLLVLLTSSLIFFGILSFFYGDRYFFLLAAYLAGIIYVVNFSVLRQSSFLAASTKAKRKYKSSSLTDDDARSMLDRLDAHMAATGAHLESATSLPSLAAELKTTSHHLSQALNSVRNQSFFDYLAAQRIAAAKELLADPSLAHLKIEEIAERVGYNSKSAFNNMFKRLTKKTPSAYRSESLEG